MGDSHTIALGFLVMLPVVIWMYRDAMRVIHGRNRLSSQEYSDLQEAWANRSAWLMFAALTAGFAAMVITQGPEVGVVLLLAAFLVFFLGPILLVATRRSRSMVFPPRDDRDE